jgi:hypothetical protein
MTATSYPDLAAAHPARATRGRRRLLLFAAGALGLAVAAAPAAMADPSNTNTFPLDLSCSDGQHYSIAVLEPAPEHAAVHLLDSMSVLIPTRFQWHIVVTDAAGDVLDESNPPPQAVHGSSGERLDTIKCTFTQYAYDNWPDVGAVTIQVDGTVEAYKGGQR